MDVSVPNETRHERQDSDDHNRGRTRDPRLVAFAHCPEGQSACDAVNRAPSNARDRVQNDWDAVREVERERESGERQLAEAELWAERGEVGDGESAEKVEEDDGQDCGSEFEPEHGSAEGPEREGRCCGVCGKPHPHAV